MMSLRGMAFLIAVSATGCHLMYQANEQPIQPGECDNGKANCDGDDDNGCETTLGDAANCTRCGDRCSGGDVCDPTAGCVAECSNGLTKCGTSCVDTQTDPNHCGRCDQPAIARENADAKCENGQSVLGDCLPNFGNCMSETIDGCESNLLTSTSHCGECNSPVEFTNAGELCVEGVKTIGTCDLGFGDCDDDAMTGCEINVLTSSAHCGSCDRQVMFINAAGSCVGGTPTIGLCSANFGNCNSNAEDGCEINLHTDPSHCGSCNNPVIFANAIGNCVGGNKELVSCLTGFGNCDNNVNSGCELDVRSDPMNCGACGTKVVFTNAVGLCRDSLPVMGACIDPFLDCNNATGDGCEVNRLTNINHCGACNTSAVRPNAVTACTNGQFEFIDCVAGFGDCDGNLGNGCETITTNNNFHCGMCGNECDQGSFCEQNRCRRS